MTKLKKTHSTQRAAPIPERRRLFMVVILTLATFMVVTPVMAASTATLAAPGAPGAGVVHLGGPEVARVATADQDSVRSKATAPDRLPEVEVGLFAACVEVAKANGAATTVLPHILVRPLTTDPYATTPQVTQKLTMEASSPSCPGGSLTVRFYTVVGGQKRELMTKSLCGRYPEGQAYGASLCWTAEQATATATGCRADAVKITISDTPRGFVSDVMTTKSVATFNFCPAG